MSCPIKTVYLLDDGIPYKGFCLTCGGKVKILNDGADGLCRNCGRVACDVQVRAGQFIEGFSKEHWENIQENIASGYILAPLTDDDIPF